MNNNDEIDRAAYAMRYHIAMAVWMLMSDKTSKIPLEDNCCKNLCADIITKLKGDCKDYYLNAWSIVQDILEQRHFAWMSTRSTVRNEEVVNAIIISIKNGQKQ